MRAPFLEVIPRGYPFLVRFKIRNYWNVLRPYLYFGQISVFIGIETINY